MIKVSECHKKLQGHFTTNITRSESNIKQRRISSDTVRTKALEEKFCFEAFYLRNSARYEVKFLLLTYRNSQTGFHSYRNW